MIKKLLALFAAAVMTFGSAVAGVPEGAVSLCDEITANAKQYGNFVCKVHDNGTVEIIAYSGSERNVVIPSEINGRKVTSIGDMAFKGREAPSSITIPNSITSIGVYSFSGCCSLKSITIPNSITSISEGAFSDCEKLSSVSLPDNLTSIGNGAFSSCEILENITIPDNVTSIGNGAFSSCEGLVSVSLPDSITSISENAFWRCTSLTSITIPNSVLSIGKDSFGMCNSLKSLTIPSSVTSIGEGTFSFCTSITSIIIPNSVNSIGVCAFSGCKSLTSITIPNSVTSIGEGAFSSCTSLTSITIPNSITSIGELTFNNCDSLESITIPNSVTSIGNYAFSECKRLVRIILPNNVTSIGWGAFYNCSSLTNITIPNSVTSIGDGAFDYCDNITIQCYIGSVAEKYVKNNDINYELLAPPHTHTYTSKVTTAATCTKDGVKTYTCECGDSYTETIKATGHKYTDKVMAPTYDTEGYTLHTCSVCGVSYKDSFTAKLTRKSISKASVSGLKNKYYTGKAIKQTPVVKLGNKTLKSGTDYTVTYKNNKAVGTATVTITGKGAYTGTVKATFKICPKKTTLKTVKSPKTNQLKATYTKVAGVTGYQITYSTSSKFTKTTTKSVNASGTSKTISKLTKGKTYYVKVRTYKTIGKTKYYSGYSAVKKVKVK